MTTICRTKAFKLFPLKRYLLLLPLLQCYCFFYVMWQLSGFMLALILQRQLFPYFAALTDTLFSLLSSLPHVSQSETKLKKNIVGMTENCSHSGWENMLKV